MVRALLVVAFVLMSACSNPGSSASSPARVTGTPLAPASGLLDAQVVLPPNFPADVPIYPGARLTAGASFASTGQVSWGMEWESPVKYTTVVAFYTKQFDQGDWTISITGSGATFSAKVTRKSDSRFTGTLVIDPSSGIDKILLSLVTAA
ncbi:MAG TPA: hypothetical protein VN906_14035 [Candidatus Sulfotelmatobacter sp.]|nr:hypothetical protein [Candidatus Sulfotelmatobacter sp.]